MYLFKIIRVIRIIKNSSQGFTLIELLVVMFITAALAGMITFNFAETRRQQAVIAATNETVSQLRQIQSWVLAGQEVVANLAPEVYEVRFVTGATDYMIYYCLDYESGSCNVAWVEYQTKNLPQNILVQTTTNIRFTAPQGRIAINGNLNEVVEITLAHSSGERSATVTVDGISGRITSP